MKTAVSIPDETFLAAERVAKRLAVSRSQLYARAISEYVREHSTEGVTAALDRVYAGGESAVDPLLSELQRRSTFADEW